MTNVVFDTNAYRNFIIGKSTEEIRKAVEKLKFLEFKNGFRPAQNITVLTELIRHLADKNDYDYSDCKNALLASALHNRVIENDKFVFSYSPTIELLLYKELTGETETSLREFNVSVSLFAHNLEQNFTDEFIEKENLSIQINLTNTTNNRLEFYSSLEKVLLSIDPESKDWKLFKDNKDGRRKFLAYLESSAFDRTISESFIFRIINLFPNNKIEITDENIKNFKQKFPAVIEMNRQFLKSIVDGLVLSEIEHTRWNTFNDLMIMLSSNLNKDEYLLITDDGQIKNSFKKCGIEKNVKTLKEYLEILKF